MQYGYFQTDYVSYHTCILVLCPHYAHVTVTWLTVSLLWYLAMEIVSLQLQWHCVHWPGWWEGDAEGVVHCCPDAVGQCGVIVVGKVDAIMGKYFDVSVVDAGDRWCLIDVSQMGVDSSDVVRESQSWGCWGLKRWGLLWWGAWPGSQTLGWWTGRQCLWHSVYLHHWWWAGDNGLRLRLELLDSLLCLTDGIRWCCSNLILPTQVVRMDAIQQGVTKKQHFRLLMVWQLGSSCLLQLLL